LFIHESTFNSLLRVADDSFFPYIVRNANISDSFLKAFPSIAEKFGNKSNVSMALTLMPNGTAAPIKFNATRGIVIGDLDDVKSVMTLQVSNDTVNDTKIAIL
jgi:hypothetical protein